MEVHASLSLQRVMMDARRRTRAQIRLLSGVMLPTDKAQCWMTTGVSPCVRSRTYSNTQTLSRAISVKKTDLPSAADESLLNLGRVFIIQLEVKIQAHMNS